MKRINVSIALAVMVFSLSLAQNKSGEIRLIIRGDDMGSCHSANIACIKSFQEGIMRSVEIMVPCAWFPEAVKMLAENPGLDVGVHISITSEWENIKWGPVSYAPSLTDKNGYFFPMIWPNEQRKLAKEYGLEINPNNFGVKRFPLEEKGKTLDERIDNFITALQKLEPGNTYIYIEHPGLDTPEMQAIGHKGYFDVATDRDLVTKTYTNEKVKEVIKQRNIRLISYKDLLVQ
jgi:hypothetical protein